MTRPVRTAAIVWAAIDWSRAGLTRPIPEEQLRELWPNYARGGEPTEERFQEGLAWALRPVYGSIALLERAGSYRAYDYIVDFVDRDDRAKSKINPHSWDRILELASDEEAVTLAAVAAGRGDWERAERALVPADQADDPEVAGVAAFNLGLLLQERGDLDEAVAAFRRADEHGNVGATTRLGLQLGDRGDLAGAEAAFRRADERGDALAAHNLGVLLKKRGDLAGAEAAFRRADERGNASGAKALGGLLLERGDLAGAEAAWRQGDQRGDASSAYNLGRLLEIRGDLNEIDGAKAAYRRADARGHADAANNLGVLLATAPPIDRRGAEAAYRRADERGNATAANNLGMLLRERGDLDEAVAAFRRADERGHADAIHNLGLLLRERGDLDEAVAAFRRAAKADDSAVRQRALAALESLRRFRRR
jgi:tetratricopeptide (TPR) repeat protein